MTQSTGPRGRYLDIHVLQTLPYANLNRDDTNSIKTVDYGGTSRTRISSQCWKRAARLRLENALGQKALRTRRLPERLQTYLVEAGWPQDLAHLAGIQIARSSSVGLKAQPGSKAADSATPTAERELTAAMIYLPETAIAELAQVADQHRALLEAFDPATAPKTATKKSKTKDKNSGGILPTSQIDAILRSRNGVINLFGRMLAEVDDAAVDAAAQVAHAFTTHTTDSDTDYLTAVDDVTALWNDEAGSAHLDTAEHSAGVFYRYATLDLHGLHHNLAGDLAALAELTTAFLSAFLLSIPPAKNTSTAPHTVPNLAHLVVRSDRPVSYADAFEQPIHAARAGGYAHPSRQALTSHAHAVADLLGTEGILHSAYASLEKNLPHLGTATTSFKNLIDVAVTTACAPTQDQGQ